jgi:hypothetical protein
MFRIQTVHSSSTGFKPISSETGAAIIFVLVLSVIAMIVISSFFFTSRYTIKKGGNRREKIDVLNIAEAGKEEALAMLRSKAFNPAANQNRLLFSNEPFSAGTYSVSCSSNVTLDTVYISSTGTVGPSSITIDVVASIAPAPWRKWIRGALTARTAVDLLGNIEIDGRDYDTTGATGLLLSPVGGIFGVSSGGAVNQGGSSDVGGHTTAPTNTKLTGVTVQENIDTTGYPTTPEEVLGLPPGALDAYKTSSCPPSGYKGIIYTDKACEFAGGIYICHNSSGTASLGNYHGNFKGLIIADMDSHINGGATILGAIIFLGKSTGGNCIGNGGATIHYSSQMLNEVTSALGASSRRTVTVLSWSERR